MPLFRTRTETLRSRIAKLEAELPDLQRLADNTADVWADEPDNDELRSDAHRARIALQTVTDDISILTRQLARAEAKDEEDRRIAEERQAAKARLEKQQQLNALTAQAHKQALDLSAKIENLLSAKTRLRETLQTIQKIADVGVTVEYGLPALIAAEEKAIGDGAVSWETGRPHRPLVKRFAEIRDTSRDLIERKYRADLDYEPVVRETWSGKQDLGMVQHEEFGAGMVPEPFAEAFPLPHERNRAAYRPSDFGTWPPASPKLVPASEDRSEQAAVVAGSASKPVDGPAATEAPALPADLPGEGLDSPDYIAEARHMGVPADA